VARVRRNFCHTCRACSEDERGVADILAIAFMFIVLVFAGVLLHYYSVTPLRAATDRQLSLKSGHIYGALDKAQVGSYTLSYLRAAAENLVLAQPTVPGDYLRSRMDNTLEYLRPLEYAVVVSLTRENAQPWVLVCPSGAGQPAAELKQFTHRGVVSVTKAEAAGERVVLVQVAVTFFRLP